MIWKVILEGIGLGLILMLVSGMILMPETASTASPK